MSDDFWPGFWVGILTVVITGFIIYQIDANSSRLTEIKSLKAKVNQLENLKTAH